MKKLICSLILLTFLVSTVSAYSIVVHPLDSSGDEIPNTVFDYRFEFSNDSACANVILSHEETIETSNAGIAVIQIDTSTISQIPKYICEYKNLVLRTTHDVSDQFFNVVYADSVNVTNNITANEGFFKLNWSFIQNAPGFSLISDLVSLVGNWSLDKTDYYTKTEVWNSTEILNGTLALNSSLSDYYLNSNPSSYYNSTDFSIGDYYLNSNPFGFYNSSDFSITDYYLDSNPLNFLNKTNTDLLYAVLGYGDDWNKTYADTIYYGIENPFSFYNSTDFNIADYYAITNPFGFYNSTDFSIGDYRLLTNNIFTSLIQANTGINTTYINATTANFTTLTVGNANIEDTYWNFTKLLNGTLVQNSTLNTRLGDYIKNNTDGYVIKASEVNVTGYGYFSWLGNLANKITTIFAVTIHADVLNSTGTIYSNQTCYTQDCSARIYHNGTGIIITS